MKKNVVRVLALVLVALMCLSLVPLAAHAEAHVHEMAEDHQDPTCVDNGFNQTYCPICGATFSMEYIPATGVHSFMNVVDEQYLILEGDCEHAFQYWKSCSVCQQSAEEAYANALDAMYEELNNRKNSGEQADWEQIVKDRVLLLDEKYKFSYGGEGHHYIHVDHQEATCTSDGWKEYSYCDVCGEYFNYESIPAKGHRWGEYTQTKAPTCTEAGEKVRVCEVCDEKDVVVLPALGHAWGEFKVTKEATCTEDGSRERVCSVCNEKEVQVIPAAHKFGEYVVTLEPTCFVDGSRERTCTVCGHKEVEAIPAAHTYGEFTVTQEPTCHSTGAKTATCTVCGEEHTEWIDMVPHKYENGECIFCHEAMPEGYVAPSDDRTEITETAGSETETTDNQTTEPETTDNQTAETQTTETETTAPEQQNAEPSAEAAPVNTVTITFDGNGATGGSMAAQTVAEGSIQALNVNTFTRDGYLFLGWDVAADGSAMGEDRFLDGEAVEVNRDVTLYAQWKLDDSAPVLSLSAGDAPILGLGATHIEIQLDDSAVSEAKVGDLLKVKVTPDSPAYNYQWYRIVKEGQDPVLLSSGPEYRLQKADATYHVNCSVYEDDPGDALSADNTVRVRLDVPFPVTVKGQGTVVTTNEDKPNFKAPETITYDPNGETPNPFEIGALTENEVSLMVTPSSGYLIRYVKENSTTVIPASRNAKSYTIDSVQANQENHRFEVYFDNYEIRISADTAILPSDISTESNSDIKQSFMDAYVNKLGLDPSLYSAYYYVTPCWKGNPAAPISDTDLSAIGSFDFSLDMPAGVTSDNYDSFEVHVYHYVKKTNTWENVTFTPDKTTEPGKVKAKIINFSNFSPFAIVALPSVKLEYDSNGGTGTMDAKTTQVGNKVTIENPSFSAPDNQTFDTWKDSEGNEYKVGDEITLTEDLKLYAQWKQGYTIIFDANDSNNANTYGSLVTGKMDPMYVTAGESVIITNQYHLKNHEQLGWSKDPGANNTADPQYNGSFTPEENLKLYAVWKRTQISITFNPNDGGSGNMPDQPVAINSSVRLNKNVFTAKNSNQEFAGWSDTPNGNIKYKDQEIIDIAETDIPLWAVWRDKKNIHFLPGKGTGNEYTQPFSSGVDTKLDALSKMNFTAPEKSEFEKWNNKADGSGDVSYGDGETITNPTAEIYLFAQWKTNMYDVTFVKGAEGASGTMATQTITNGTPTKLTKNAFTYPKYEFDGWKDQNGAEYKDEASISTITENLTLTAQWKRVVFDVTFAKGAEDASGTMEVQSIRNGTATPLTKNAFTYTGNRFKNWKDQDNVAYTDGQSISSITKDLTLTAQWEPIWTIQFDKNHEDATGTMDDLVFVKDVVTPIPENKFTRTNYKVVGWTETEGGTTAEIALDANAPQKNTKLYAVWEREKVTLTLDANDKTAPETPTKETKQIDKALAYKLPTIESLGFTFPNRTFVGWNTVREPSEADPGKAYADGVTLTADVTTKNITLYAQWDYAVTYKKGAEDATGEMELQSFEFNKEFTLSANEFTRTNYEFNGWKDENNDPYSDQQKVRFDKSHTLTAQWKKTQYSVIYVNPDDDSKKVVDSIPTNQKTKLINCPFEAKPDMIFGGWSDDYGNIYQPGDEIGTGLNPTTLEPNDIKLTAVWKKAITVYFYPGDGGYQTQIIPEGIATKLTTFKNLGFTSPSGQTFAYWVDPSNNQFFDGTVVTLTADTFLTAVYGETVTVTYHANGGTVTVQNSSGGKTTKESTDQAAAKGVDYKLYTADQLNLKRDGYKFEGWTLSAGGSTIKYTDGQTIENGFNQNTTIYAKWKRVKIADTVTISGSTTGSDPNAIWGETLTATVVDPELKTGFIYTWKVGDVEVQKGESNTLEVKPEYYGKEITCTVTHPQAENEVVSNIKTVGVYAVEEDGELRIVNSRAKYPGLYYEVPLIFGAIPGTTYYKDGKAATVPESAASGAFEITEPGVYVFGDTTYVATQWWTIGYSSSNGSGDNSGSGTTTMKRGSTTLNGQTKIKSGDVTLLESFKTINGYNSVWLVRDGSGITDITLTARPSSGSYGHVSRNGSGFNSSNAEQTISLGTIDEPELYEVIYNKSSSSPRTGDMSNLGLWSALCLVSFVGVTTILTSARKRKNRG